MKSFKILGLVSLFAFVSLVPATEKPISLRRVAQLVTGGGALAATATGGYYGYLRYQLSHAKTDAERRLWRGRARKALWPLVGFISAAAGGGLVYGLSRKEEVSGGLKLPSSPQRLPEAQPDVDPAADVVLPLRNRESLPPLPAADPALSSDGTKGHAGATDSLLRTDYDPIDLPDYFNGFGLASKKDLIDLKSAVDESAKIEVILQWWPFGDVARLGDGKPLKILKRGSFSGQLEGNGVKQLASDDQLLVDDAGQFYVISGVECYKLCGTKKNWDNVAICGVLVDKPQSEFTITLASFVTSSSALSDGEACFKLFLRLNGPISKKLGWVACYEEKGTHYERMEDACIIRHDENSGISAFFVCDGHCGTEAAYYCAQNLFTRMMHSGISFTHPEEVKKVLISFDEELSKKAEFKAGFFSSNGGKDIDFGPGASTPGTTVSGALVLPSGQLCLINLGDSRTIGLTDQYTLVEECVTKDHDADNSDEVSRVDAAGGFVNSGAIEAPGRTSVGVSRALGDFYLKVGLFDEDGVPKNPFGDEGSQNCPVSNLADVQIIDLSKGVRYLVVACDGLWDVMTNQQVADFIKERLGRLDSLDLIAKSLVGEARGKYCIKGAKKGCPNLDNISVIIVDLHKIVSPLSGALVRK